MAEIKTRKYNKIYTMWSNMIRRCYKEDDISYKNYGYRGIRVCNEWLNYEKFKIYIENSDYELGLSIDRIDNDGDYEPNNCRFVDKKAQCNNKRNNVLHTYKGETMTLPLFCEKYDIDYNNARNRITRGFTIEEVIEMPKGDVRDKTKRKYLTYNGKTQTVAEWSKELGYENHVLYHRIKWFGLDAEKVLGTPITKGKYKND